MHIHVDRPGEASNINYGQKQSHTTIVSGHYFTGRERAWHQEKSVYLSDVGLLHAVVQGNQEIRAPSTTTTK